MTPALLASVRRRDSQDSQADVQEIWPDMATGVVLFFAMETQWRHGALGGLHGLDYQAIGPTAQLLDLELDPQAFHDIRAMESEVLRLARERRNG